MELLRVSAEAIPAMLALAREVLRLPPLDGSGPVSARSTETPTAVAFKATASPLNEVAFCAKQIKGLKASSTVKQIAIIDVLFSFIVTFSLRS